MSDLAPAAQPSESSQQDRKLVRQALQGDQRAYSALVNKYTVGLRLHIGKLVRDRHVVDDLTQDVFVKAFGALASYSSAYAFSTWLYKIASNHSIDYLRKRRLKTLSLDKPVKTKDGEIQIELPDETQRADRAVEHSQTRNLIQREIDTLPPKYNRVIVMRHQKEMSYDEIAQALQLPLGTVKAHIFRARRLLYTRLKDKRESL